MMLADVSVHITVPGMSAKWVIGSIALFHTAVASLAIGFAFVVTMLQIIGYLRKERGYDLLAKRIQLWHVCMYNIGTINAIGLVFVLSGLYPQFWSQIFTNFFWTMIVEEVCFFLLATTLTFHYFFWDKLWGHKKLHIFLGALLTPLFLFQFYYINGMSSIMLTPGVGEGEVSQWAGTAGITGWSKVLFYNPSFIMLTFHRVFANFSYGSFVAAGVCGTMMFFSTRPRIQEFYEKGGRMAFHIGFVSLLALPIVGFAYAWVLKYHAKEAYVNLMWGRGDVVAGGIDWWWVKHIIVVSMIGMGLFFHWRGRKAGKDFTLPTVMVYAIAVFYSIYYIMMGPMMTWKFVWAMLGCAVLAAMLSGHLLNYHKGSGRAVFVLVGILSFATVMLGGYAREASRPRFVSKSGLIVEGREDLNRYAAYDDIYVPPERQKAEGKMTMVLSPPSYEYPVRPGLAPVAIQPEQMTPENLISEKCSSCHTLKRIREYKLDNWRQVVRRMARYETKITPGEEQVIAEHLKSGKPF